MAAAPRTRAASVTRKSGEKIGVEADGEKDHGSRELVRNAQVAGAGRLDAGETAAHLGGEARIGIPVEQAGFPDRMFLGRQIPDDKRARFRVLTEDLGHRAGHDRRRQAKPARLVDVSFRRHMPIGRDLELGKCALDAHLADRQHRAPDVGRHTARQRLPRHAPPRGNEPHRDQPPHHIARQFLNRHGHEPSPPHHVARYSAPRGRSRIAAD